MKKQMLFKTKGMNQDLSVSAFNPEFSFENMNLRLSTNENNTLLSWVNEKGTGSITLYNTSEDIVNIQGKAIGVAVINHNIVLFTYGVEGDNPDHIYKIYAHPSQKYSYILETLYEGNLGFSGEHPLETLVSYESDLVQKVYWTDGNKQPRVINIVGRILPNNNNQFDFIPTLQLKETISVEKMLGATGLFAPGVIQYAFTYYNKYGQESNIFYTTPLNYISYKERGGSPKDKIENAFKITVNNVDTNFEYLRIYSIQRTSIDATPICKRIQDIATSGLTDNKASFIDTGTTGESIDPTELLFKGGEVITAETMSQKDNTLFMGNIKVSRPMIEIAMRSDVREAISLEANLTREFSPIKVSYGSYSYANQLTSIGGESRDAGVSVPCAGFKTGNYYRCGVQFQHESGKWTDPIWADDILVKSVPKDEGSYIKVPIIKGKLAVEKQGGWYPLFDSLINAGYRKIRPVVVFPDMMDRDVICQGVVNPTVYTNTQRINDKNIYAQSSWFFRPYQSADDAVTDTTNNPKSRNLLEYTQRNIEYHFPDDSKGSYDPQRIRKVEIEGDFESDNKFRIDTQFRTLHSPDIEFDDQLQVLDFIGTSYNQVGVVDFTHTMSDIDIQTESPTVSNSGSGFVHRAFTSEGAAGIISGLFYDDYIVDDCLGEDNHLGAYPHERAAAKWLVYPWQSNGSLNNDMNRPSSKGNATAVLKKKMISNLRYATTNLYDWNNRGWGYNFNTYPQLFSGEEDTILKIDDKIYKGNIDTLLMPDNADGKYFALDGVIVWKHPWSGDSWAWNYTDAPTSFISNNWLKAFSKDAEQQNQNGIRKWVGKYYDPFAEETHDIYQWVWGGDDIGDEFVDLDIRKSPVRMKYKSTPHLVVYPYTSIIENNNQLAIFEIQKVTNTSTRFGGRSADAFRENKWLPCGIPVSLNNTEKETIEGKDYKILNFYYDYGDTYFQRYDCLKTYAFTREDINQIVEIGSFMLETHVNIDGRYDRNRGQSNNLNMSPQNFNLLNPVYSQLDNFFTYRIQDDDVYKNNSYPNQITWSKTKASNADIDMWNNVTLASTLELDGNKGSVTSLQRLNDQLICFQDQGISQILYNENTQISTTEGVPIEIANSGKVQGKRYLSDTVGCSNKWSVVNTPAGIYFMDSNEKSIYKLGEGLQNISQQGGFNAWCKQHIPAGNIKWTPDEFNNFVGYYDKKNQDVLYINKDIALAYSEKVGAFISFYDYGNTPWFCNLDDVGIWIKNQKLWEHQAGEYCDFFSTEDYDGHRPYGMTLVGNPEPQLDKIFTNLEFRACVEGDGEQTNAGKFNFYLPFDSLETWNEYQHGLAKLDIKNGHAAMKHHTLDNKASLKRKFRIWRCDIPRDNAPLSGDAALGVSRTKQHPVDRMRNPWLYLKLQKDADTDKKVEIHDIVMTYFT